VAKGEERLEHELKDLQAWDPTCRDWRMFDPQECILCFRGAREKNESLGMLATAVFAGTVQACLRGSFWAPSYSSPAAVKVDCAHLSRPSSLLYAVGRMPTRALPVRSEGAKIACFAKCHPLDACARLCSVREHKHVAVVRCTHYKDPRATTRRYNHCREDQVFLRSTYYQSFENMSTEIHAPVAECLNEGGLIYTPGVGILRGPIEEGALWFQDPPRCDIMWTAVQAHPKVAEQGQYALEIEKRAMEVVIDRIFAWAAKHEVDVLVLPPLGCGSNGCMHPALDVADIIYNTAHRYGQYIPQVCIASDYPPHFENGWWEAFSMGVQHGRPAIVRPVLVPVPPYPLARKSPKALADKAMKANKMMSRDLRYTFL